jgi:glycosyltransferase involved in cell wall biosynthesis
MMDQAPSTDRDEPLVSAVIIFLNEEKFLSEAIDSVFTQTYRNWELLLVDDGSIDASTEVARRYAEQHPDKIYYLEHEEHRNRGMSASRNLGIRRANGEYIAFLDADDVWLSHKLERQVTLLRTHPEAAMIYGSPLLWHGWTGRSEDAQRDRLQPITVETDTLIRPPRLFSLFLTRKAITPCPSDVLICRQILDDIGRFEESFKGLFEDQVFFSKVALEVPVFVSGECWSKHRKHPDSATAMWKRTGELDFLNWIQEYLHLKQVKAPMFRKALRSRRRRYDHPILFRLLRRAQSSIENTNALLKKLMRGRSAVDMSGIKPR